METNMSRSTKWGISLLVIGVMIGAGGVQAWQLLAPPKFLNTGLFTLQAGDTALFNVTLDDVKGAPPANVVMQLLDPAGVLVARKAVVLNAGQSATLRYDVPGVYRAHAEIVSPNTIFSSRRRLITTLEILGGLLDSLTSGCAPRIFVCSSSDDGAGNGRLPDQ
jgi:hypothetical protein